MASNQLGPRRQDYASTNNGKARNYQNTNYLTYHTISEIIPDPTLYTNRQ